MKRSVFCLKLKKEAEALENPPLFSELGTKIYHHVSKEAWGLWLKHQTILINEQRLNLAESKARAFLIAEMDRFFFGE